MKLHFTLIYACAALCTAGLSGCGESGQASDEEREAHFMSGKTLVNELDYKGAVEAFERSLEINPRSAAAHFELACLYEHKEADPAAAIFHYERYLKFRPAAENEETVQQRILACKQQLAKDVEMAEVTRSMEREYEKLNRENARLRAENAVLRGAVVRPVPGAGRVSGAPPVTPVVLRVVNVPGRAQPILPGPGAVSGSWDSGGETASSRASNRNETPGSGNSSSGAAAVGSARTHSVKPGENLTVIARRYGVKVTALMAANPRVDEHRLRVGQALAIPRA